MKYCLTIIAAGVALAIAPNAGAQSVHRETLGGVERTIELGDLVWRSRDFEGTAGVVTQNDIDVPWGDDESIFIPAYTELVIIREKELKACLRRNSTHLSYSIVSVDIKGWDTCLIDKNDDGRFDLITKRKLGGSKPINSNATYYRQLVPLQGKGAWANRKTVNFTGSTKESLLLSYREYSNRFLSPNITEKLTLPRPTKFPAEYSIKGRKLTILSLSDSTMRYKLGITDNADLTPAD